MTYECDAQPRMCIRGRESLSQCEENVFPKRIRTIAIGGQIRGIGTVAGAAAEKIDGHHVIVVAQVPTEIAPHATVGEDAMDEDDEPVMIGGGVFVESHFQGLSASGVE